MGKTLSGHQPDFLPWLGMFYKMANCDVFRLADYVKFTLSYTNRVRIMGPDERPMWLTVPIEKSTSKQAINDVLISRNLNWKANVMGKIQANYGKAPHYFEIDEILNAIDLFDGERLVDLNLELLRICQRGLGVHTQIMLGSDMNIRKGKSEHIVDSCKKCGCSTFLAGQGSAYIDNEMLESSGITLKVSDFVHPTFDDAGWASTAGLSIIHYVSHLGWERTRKAFIG